MVLVTRHDLLHIAHLLEALEVERQGGGARPWHVRACTAPALHHTAAQHSRLQSMGAARPRRYALMLRTYSSHSGRPLESAAR